MQKKVEESKSSGNIIQLPLCQISIFSSLWMQISYNIVVKVSKIPSTNFHASSILQDPTTRYANSYFLKFV